MINKFNSPPNPLDNTGNMLYNQSFLGWEKASIEEMEKYWNPPEIEFKAEYAYGYPEINLITYEEGGKIPHNVWITAFNMASS